MICFLCNSQFNPKDDLKIQNGVEFITLIIQIKIDLGRNLQLKS